MVACALKKNEADRVSVYCTHPLSFGVTMEYLELDKLVVTNIIK